MQKDVRYGGLATNPSDYDAQDGQLSAAVGLVHEDGAMRNVWQPEVMGAEIGSNRKILFLHATRSYRHYILERYVGHPQDEVDLQWIEEEYMLGDYGSVFIESHIHTIRHNIKEVVSVSAVGNTLLVMTSQGMFYYRWKDDSYLSLGQKPPELQIKFTTTGTHAANYPGPFAAGRGNGRGYAAYCAYDGGPMVPVDNIEAMVNTTHKIITDSNHFYAPFNIRYCYRLFDGSMVMHSAPVFMPISVPYTILIENAYYYISSNDGAAHQAQDFYEKGELVNYRIDPTDVTFRLRYQPNNVSLRYIAAQLNNEERRNLEDWDDIIKSVDVFITYPILRETSFLQNPQQTIKVIDIKHHSYYNVSDPTGHTSLDLRQLKTDYSEADWDRTKVYAVEYPMIPATEYLEKIKNSSTYYKIASFDLEKGELEFGGWHDLPIKTGVLSALTSQEVLEDDYRTHNIFMPHYDVTGKTFASMFAYNNRLNVTGVDDKLFEGFDITAMVPYDYRVATQGHGYCWPVVEVRVVLQTDDGEKIVSKQYSGALPTIWQTHLMNNPLFYPDNRAKKLQICLMTPITPGSSQLVPRWYEFAMEECPLINGAMTQGGIFADISTAPTHNDLPSPIAAPGTIDEGKDIVNTTNKVYTSEVDNPYYFPTLGINSIGTGQILATVAVTKPLSEGQFGQFSLYAFCTDGVWALKTETNSGDIEAYSGDTEAGLYRTIKPVTRDVVTNIWSITQTDDAVLFVTDRGIMLLQGRETVCITDGILGEEAFDVTELPHIKDGNIRPTLRNMTMSHTFLSGCRMIYDYEHQHIVVYNPEQKSIPGGTAFIYPYAFVYSMKSRMWGMMENRLTANVNSYPDAMAINKDGRLVSFGETGSQTTVEGLLVTRPLKLDTPDLYKTVHTMVQRGVFKKGHVKTLLYGSRDLRKWYLIGSSVDEWLRGLRGTPMQWLRIALVTDLEKGESVSGATVDFEVKERRKLH
ncbi:MAG: hypothetical protein K6F72_00195 [Bacteroidales bacterium]|nr:hypothetical protein [Bacteroidales bacterium]